VGVLPVLRHLEAGPHWQRKAPDKSGAFVAPDIDPNVVPKQALSESFGTKFGTGGRADNIGHVKTAAALEDIVLPDSFERDVRLGSLWQDRPVALVWLRHYG
jgi:hypothetical protein